MDLSQASRRSINGIRLEIFNTNIFSKFGYCRMAASLMLRSMNNIITGILSLIKGLIITFNNNFTSATTLQYPDEKKAMTERFRGLIDLYPEKCVACYQCVKACPTACLAMTHKQTDEKKKITNTFTYNIELCCFCGLCQQVCPTGAIYMNKIYEITTYERNKLYINLLNPEKYDEWPHTSPK